MRQTEMLDPRADTIQRAALLAGLQETRGDVPLIDVDAHINDPDFADLAAKQLVTMIAANKTSSR